MFDLSYIINEVGEEREQWLNAVSPPIFQTSIFCFDSVAKLREGLRDEQGTPFYTRGHNPTVAALQQKLAALEGAGDCLLFGSGSAAVAAAVMSCVEAGDHVVCVRKPYGWTGKLLNDLLSRYGVETSFVDGTDTDAIRGAVSDATKLIYLESPNSITFEMQDLEAVAAFARERGIATICDNSYATPLLQRPIELGIDMTVHSATKYLNGHSDVVAGVLCGSREQVARVFEGPYMTLGGICGPFDAWLLMRGLRTLPVRLERIAKTTERIIAHLDGHPRIRRIHYPQHPRNPQRELARRSMKGGNGLFSVELECEDIAGVERFCDTLERFLIACSWGGYESLVYPMAGLVDSANYQKSRELPWNLVRFSIGLEEPEVLVRDLDRALDAI